jgi:FtsP/CotA-like multicopper oxidase with cupredoxin domain
MSEDRKFTLQVCETVDVEVPMGDGSAPGETEPREAWFDVAVVTVPPRAKTMTALRAAAKQAGVELPEDGLKVRLLPGDVAEPITLLPPAPAPGPRQVRL